MGGKGGGGGGARSAGAAESAEARRLAGIQADISQRLFSESDPVRARAFGLVNRQLSSLPLPGQSPIRLDEITQAPQFEPLKAATEAQFARARENVLASLPRGGRLDNALTNVERARAGALSANFGALASEEAARRERVFENAMNRGVSLSTGVPAVSLGGLSGSQSTFANLAGQQAAIAQSQAQADAQKAGGLGQGVGFIAGNAVAPGLGKK